MGKGAEKEWEPCGKCGYKKVAITPIPGRQHQSQYFIITETKFSTQARRDYTALQLIEHALFSQDHDKAPATTP
jgi:hypothetical protein